MTRLPSWAPKAPPHTCPDIDELRKQMKDLADRVKDTIDGFIDELEEIRSDNTSIREWGYDCVDAACSIIDDLEDRVKKAQ